MGTPAQGMNRPTFNLRDQCRYHFIINALIQYPEVELEFDCVGNSYFQIIVLFRS